MKNKIFLLLIFSLQFLFLNSFSQPGEWTWVHGSNFSGAGGNFGVQGIPSPFNVPPALYEAIEFKDLSGNLWIYGGVGTNGVFNDLWKYDPVANEWTWMRGTNTPNDPGVYGTQGISSPLNYPPAQGYGAASWTDLNGNFWLLGGFSSFGDMNALWKYDVGTNEWTWMTGSNSLNQPGTYGTQGVPSILNTPGAREETAGAWTDNAGDLWLFGGYNIGLNWNDLWRYHIATNEWTWMKGSQFSAQPGVYGTIGVEDPANVPGARQVYSRWTDMNGNLWLFGGGDYPNNTFFNDMWRYNMLTNNWTWMNGSSMQNAPGNYGIQCVPSLSNVPASRFECRGACVDASGNFWMFGGGRGGTFIPEVWNDLWMYCTSTNQWTWMDNDTITNPIGNWGTVGVSSPLNIPNGRSGNLLWSDNSGHLYSFGGTTANYNTPFQDMWKYTIDSSCALCSTLPIALFNAPNHICPGTCTSFNNISVNAVSYVWDFPGGSPNISTDVDPQNICYSAPGVYPVTLIATNANGNDTLTLINFITVYPYPPPQGINQSGDTLFAIPGAVTYQWYQDGNIIPGATDYFYVAMQSGNYNVVATDANNCEVEAVIYDVVASTTPVSFGEGSGVRLFPNPVTEKLEIRIPVSIGNKLESTNVISIYNMLGDFVFPCEIQYGSLDKKSEISINVQALKPGLYWLELTSPEITLRAKFVKE
jgi:PKD repeat protein